jgi:hypothetical protein
VDVPRRLHLPQRRENHEDERQPVPARADRLLPPPARWGYAGLRECPTSAWLRIYRRSTRLYARRVRLAQGINRLSLPSLRTGTYRLTLGGRRATLRIG